MKDTRRDAPRAGYCPAREGCTPETPLGHRFDVQDPEVRCMDCGTPMDDLYVPGTYIERDPPALSRLA